MLRILKSPEAENDLDEIWLYIAKDNSYYADKLLDEIEETSPKLARFPNMVGIPMKSAAYSDGSRPGILMKSATP